MVIEDKKYDEGIFSGIKNVINEITNFIDESRKYKPQFDAIKNVGKQKKTKEELDLMLQLCAEMKRQSKSKYMKRLLYKFIEELEMQKDGEQGLAAGMIGPTQLNKISKSINIIGFISFFVLWIAFDLFIAFVVVIIFAVCAGIFVSKIEAKNKRIREGRQTDIKDLITFTSEGQTETVALLLDKGDDTRIMTSKGETSLSAAEGKGYIGTVELLKRASSKAAINKTVIDDIQKQDQIHTQQKLSLKEIDNALITTLQMLGGSAKKKVVEQKVYDMLQESFRNPWYQEESTPGIQRWKHQVNWARNRARERGLIKSTDESGQGNWELTESGMKEPVPETCGSI